MNVCAEVGVRGRGANGGETVTSRKKVFHEVDDERRKERKKADQKTQKAKRFLQKKLFEKVFCSLVKKSDFSKKTLKSNETRKFIFFLNSRLFLKVKATSTVEKCLES